MPGGQRGEGALELFEGPLDLQRLECDAQELGRAFQRRVHIAREWLRGISRAQHSDAGCMWHGLLEQLEILRCQLRADEGEPGKIPARVSQARREARPDRIPDPGES